MNVNKNLKKMQKLIRMDQATIWKVNNHGRNFTKTDILRMQMLNDEELKELPRCPQA